MSYYVNCGATALGLVFAGVPCVSMNEEAVIVDLNTAVKSREWLESDWTD